ncbi:unnamed protein product [Clonostachys rhizophaga]|uniref:Uncharacterized protein n=1 Tax=Clonostachys rhizophaga TaxID=160324 RepID=A0A9N9VAZ2_9HYPO|nr:unnamed protein product [Clonostachys rhizophaga]
MIRATTLRRAGRLFATGIAPSAACIGTVYLLRPRPIQLDAIDVSPRQHQSQRAGLSTKAVQQIASGSMAVYFFIFLRRKRRRRGKQVIKLIASFALGFGCGLIIAIFSRTLAFLGSILAVSIYVTSRYGIDLPQILGIKKFLLKSSVWRKLGGSPWFTASFALTFTLAAFVHL